MKKGVLIYYRQEKNSKRKYVLINDVNRFMYDRNLHDGRKYSCWFCLQSFSTKEILKLRIKDFFEIIGK